MLAERDDSLSVNYRANRLAAGVFWLVFGAVLALMLYWRLARRFLGDPNLRALGYTRLQWPGLFDWLSPPPLGRLVLLALYWASLVVLSLVGVRTDAAGSTEPVAFRFGWTALTQLPLIFLAVTRWNPLSVLLGVPPERLEWAHRWVGLTFVVMSTIHGALFVDQYIKHHVFWMELRLLPTLRDGFWAWGLLAWTALSTLPPIRRLSYELFVLQHLVSAGAFLYLTIRHVGRNNRLLVLASIGVFGLDWAARTTALVLRNVSRDGRWVGFAAELSAVDDSVTILTVSGVRFTWTAGQHVFVWLPRLPFQTPHPFTMMALPSSSGTLRLAMRTKTGFTKQMSRRAADQDRQLRVFLGGPFGTSLPWEDYDNVILLSSSTGTSYSLSVLGTLTSQKIFVLAIVRRPEHLSPYLGDLKRHAKMAEVTVAITGRANDGQGHSETEWLHAGGDGLIGEGDIETHVGRPEVAPYLRKKLTRVPGRTVVSVCGCSSLVADVRRAVKGLAFAGVDVLLHIEGGR